MGLWGGGGGRSWELGKVFGGERALNLQGLLGESEPGDPPLGLWTQGLGWAWPWVAAGASLTPLCVAAWRSLPASCPLPLPPPLGHLRAAL